jgi:myotubularin-related protein 14
VILYEGKNICRSATISGGAEIYGRSGIDFFFTGGESIPGQEAAMAMGNTEWQLFNRIRGQDIRLLKVLQIKNICDLMVEKKKVKFGMK